MKDFKLSYQQLCDDLYECYLLAAKNKEDRGSLRKFEENLRDNLLDLANDLWNRTYVPGPMRCFVLDELKKREVFASVEFRDRVVHQLYKRFTSGIFANSFIEDSYGCLVGRGTHFGIRRLQHHIKSESQNYSKECWVLKLDIRGFFYSIDRPKLLEITEGLIRKMADHNATDRRGFRSASKWREKVDIDFILYLTRVLLDDDPLEDCVLSSPVYAWDNVERAKTLWNSPPGKGVAAGNLYVQILANVYLNVFDQFVKRELKCRHYGRYVDDAYIVSCDKEWLWGLVPKIEAFLRDELGLTLHRGKLRLCNARYGVEFLGAWVKPYRTYVSNQSLARMRYRINKTSVRDGDRLRQTVNSYLGILSHFSAYNIKGDLFLNEKFMSRLAFDRDMRKALREKDF